MDNNDFETAARLVATLEQFLEQNPQSADARHELGLIYFFAGQFDEALEQLNQAVALRPTCRQYLVDLGKTYKALGEYMKGSDFLVRAQQANGECDAPWQLLQRT